MASPGQRRRCAAVEPAADPLRQRCPQARRCPSPVSAETSERLPPAHRHRRPDPAEVHLVDHHDRSRRRAAPAVSASSAGHSAPSKTAIAEVRRRGPRPRAPHAFALHSTRPVVALACRRPAVSASTTGKPASSSGTSMTSRVVPASPIDDRRLAPGQRIEQARLAGIRRADQDDRQPVAQPLAAAAVAQVAGDLAGNRRHLGAPRRPPVRPAGPRR